MSWRGDQSDTAIAEHVGVTIEQLKVLRSTHKLACKRLQLIDVVVRTLGSTDPLIFNPLYQNRRTWEHADIADVVAVRMRYRDVSDVARLKSDLGELIGHRPVQMVDDQFGQGRPAFGIVQRRFRNACIPEQPFASVLY